MNYSDTLKANKKYRKLTMRLRYNILSGAYGHKKEKQAVRLLKKAKKIVEQTNDYDITPPFYLN